MRSSQLVHLKRSVDTVVTRIEELFPATKHRQIVLYTGNFKDTKQLLKETLRKNF